MQSILEKVGENSIFNKTLGFLKDNINKEKPTKDDTYLGGSVSNYTQNLVMTFPLMFDNSLSPATAGIISKANERNIVTMLQLLFSSMQIDAPSGLEALKKVHKNISVSSTLDDVLDKLRNSVSESVAIVDGIKISNAVKEMTDYLKYYKKKSYPINSFREKSLNEYVILNDWTGNAVVTEATKTSKDKDDEKDNEIRTAKDARELLPRVMTDVDYKKANETAPTIMIITYNEVNSEGKPMGKSSFLAGVKSRMIGVDSSDIIDRMAAKKNTAMNFLNFIRATTGEISFTKDFLFAIKQSKINAKNAAKKGQAARMWDVLDSRHIKNNSNKVKQSGNDASAITTLVINQETVNMLRKEYNYDLEKVSTAKYIMEQYNLLGLIICDESTDTAKIMYHGNDSFEQVPYSFLQRENDNSKAYKDVINLINQTRR